MVSRSHHFLLHRYSETVVKTTSPELDGCHQGRPQCQHAGEASRRAGERHCGITCCSSGTSWAANRNLQGSVQCQSSYPLLNGDNRFDDLTQGVLHRQFVVLMARTNLGNITETSAGHIQVFKFPLRYWEKKTCIVFHILQIILFGGQNIRIDRRKKKKKRLIDCSHLNYF